MRLRATDTNGDWLFGKGQNDYKTNQDAITQDIGENLYAFKSDCFFNSNAGIDWFNLLSQKNTLALNLAIATAILNTQGVTGLLTLSGVLVNRVYEVSYQVSTVYSVSFGSFAFNTGTLS